MAKYRIIPCKHSDLEYTPIWELQKKTWFGWSYIKMDSKKDNLVKFIEFMSTPPEYHSDG